MLRRLSHSTLVNLRAVLVLLPVVVLTLTGTASTHLHIVLPAGSNWS